MSSRCLQSRSVVVACGGLLGVLAIACSDRELVTVSDPPRVVAVHISPPSLTLRPGEQATFVAVALSQLGDTLRGRPVTWSIDNTEAATIDDNGSVVALLRARSAIVRAQVESVVGESQLLTTAGVRVATSTVRPPSAELLPGGTVRVTAAFGRSATSTAQSESSDARIASVDATGLVRTGEAGQAVLVGKNVADLSASSPPQSPSADVRWHAKQKAESSKQ
jgi:hypothetical protein